MKKLIIATSIIGLTLFACKKENKDLKVVGTDANGNELVITENGDTIQKSEAETATENVLNQDDNAKHALIKNEDDTYRFKYNLTKGNTYPINLTVITTRNVSDGKQSIKMTNESKKKIDYTVQDFKDGIYTLKVTFRQYAEKLTDPAGKTLSFDTNAAKPSNPMIAMSWQVYKSIIGKSYTLKINEQGKVTSIDGLAHIRTGIENSLKSSLNAEEQKALSEMLKVSLSDEAIKSQFEETMNIYPDKNLKLKESWSDENKINEGPLKGKSKITRTLASIDEQSTKIEVKGTQNVSGSQSQQIPISEKEQTTVKLTLNDNSTVNGDILLETSSGWIKKINITQKKNVKEIQEAQGQKMTRTETTTVQTIVN
ncbi:DUF6263 family protein [Vaginella massiliensis]|uniref:DUF6263 family protein n=1 Tax=Vaginella massiliensis TaxID=1816680 RepID=UPI00375234A6